MRSLPWPSQYFSAPQHYFSPSSVQPLVSLPTSLQLLSSKSCLVFSWTHKTYLSTTESWGTPLVNSGPLLFTASTCPIVHSIDSTHFSSFKFWFLLNFNRKSFSTRVASMFAQVGKLSPSWWSIFLQWPRYLPHTPSHFLLYPPFISLLYPILYICIKRGYRLLYKQGYPLSLAQFPHTLYLFLMLLHSPKSSRI